MRYSFILLAILINEAKCQNNISNDSLLLHLLTKKQMYADFNEFIYIIKNANPQLPVRKKVSGYDQLKKIIELRNGIDTIKQYCEFIDLLRKGLNCLFDIHTGMITKNVNLSDGQQFIDTSIIDNINCEYNKWIKAKYWENRKLLSNITYIQGDYYSLGTLILKSNIINDSVTISNNRILKYNNIPISNYIYNNIDKMNAINVRWNFFKENYYCLEQPNLSYNNILTFEEKDGTVKNVDLSKYINLKIWHVSIDSIEKCKNKVFFPPDLLRRKIEYFDEDKILYIYSNKMLDSSNFIGGKIIELGTKKEINKVIIDVRNNIGGSDNCWVAILRSIIADTIYLKGKLALKNTPIIKKILKARGTEEKSIKTKKIKMLNNEKFIILNGIDTIIPDSNSLHYKGKIYILQNENVYSAGHSLSSVASYSDQLVSVGTTTGLLAGLGLGPWVFQLKNSKFTFCMETAIDITNITKIEDFYHDIPEIVISLPKEEYIKRFDDFYYTDMQSKEYLYNEDYLFEKVLELK